MAVEARRVQLIIARNLIARLTRGKPSVNFGTFDMLAGTAFSRHVTQPSLRRRPKYPIMRKPSRNHIGTAIAIPFE